MDQPTMPQTSPAAFRSTGNGDVSQQACLVRIYPASIGEGIAQLPLSRFLIGRDAECDLELEGSDISRQHAVIEFDRNQGRHCIRDLASLNGTYVNDQRVEIVGLSCGDLIRIGHTVFKFLAGDGIERQYHEAIYTMTITDGLTGIANKRYLVEALEREVVRSQRHHRPLSVAIFDIDHFKRINDTHGHLAGDAVLRELTRRVGGVVRRDELLARYGGEEFVVLLPESETTEALAFGERIRTSIAAEPFVVDKLSIHVTASVGVATTTGAADTSSQDLLARADAKLYEAKDAGRNTVRG